MKDIAVIIPAGRGGESVQRCIRSIRNACSDLSYDIFPVFNGVPVIEDNAIHPIHLSRWVVPSLARRVAEEMINKNEYEYILYVDDDMEIQDKILPVIEEEMGYADIVGGMYKFPHTDYLFCGNRNHITPDGFITHENLPVGEVAIPSDYAIGGISLVKTSVFGNGLLGHDPDLAASHEDIDFSMRAAQRGARIVSSPKLRSIHESIQSAHSWKTQELLKRSIGVFRRKWKLNIILCWNFYKKIDETKSLNPELSDDRKRLNKIVLEWAA